MMWQKAKFATEWLEIGEENSIELAGYPGRSTWNGWAKPYFTSEVITGLAIRIEAARKTFDEMTQLQLNENGTISLLDEGDEPFVIFPSRVQTTDGEQILCDLGGSWIWETGR